MTQMSKLNKKGFCLKQGIEDFGTCQRLTLYIHIYLYKKSQTYKKKVNVFYYLYFRSSYVPFKIILRNKDGVIDIGESLYKNGYATKRKFDINPSEDCILDLH